MRAAVNIGRRSFGARKIDCITRANGCIVVGKKKYFVELSKYNAAILPVSGVFKGA